MDRRAAQRIPYSKRLIALMPPQFFGGRRDLLWRQKRFLERGGIILHPTHTRGVPIAIEIYYYTVPADFPRARAMQMVRAIRSSPDLKRFRRALAPRLMDSAGRRYRFDRKMRF